MKISPGHRRGVTRRHRSLWLCPGLVGLILVVTVCGVQAEPIIRLDDARGFIDGVRKDPMALQNAVDAAMKLPVTGAANPFALANQETRLPYVESDCPVGNPSSLPADIVSSLVEKVFAAEGCQLSPSSLKTEHLHFQANGYDKKKRSGFVLVTQFNSNLDLYSDVRNYDMLEAAKNYPAGLIERADHVKRLFAAQVAVTIDSQRLDPQLKEEGQRLLTHPSLADVVKDYHAWHLKADGAKLSLGEVKQLEKDAVQGLQFVAVICRDDSRLTINGLRDEKFKQEQEKIVKEAFLAETWPEGQSHYDERDRRLTPMRAASNARLLQDFALTVREYIAWARRNGMK